jgi:hypothetical protein
MGWYVEEGFGLRFEDFADEIATFFEETLS